MGYTHAEMSDLLSAFKNLKTVETIIKESELAIQSLEEEIARLQDLERQNFYSKKGLFNIKIKELRKQIAMKQQCINSWYSYRAG